MRKKQYFILLMILAVIIAALFGMRAAKSQKEKKEEEKKEAETVYAVQFDASDVSAFSYEYDGSILEFVKTDDTWICKADETVDVDENSIESLLSTMSSITANNVIEDASDISEYGFDEPTQEMNLVFDDGSAKTIRFGMKNEVIGGYYLMVSGDDNIYLADSTYVTSTLNQNLEDLAVEEEEEVEAEE